MRMFAYADYIVPGHQHTSNTYTGNFSFFVRKLLCGPRQKLRNEVERRDGEQTGPVVQHSGLRQILYFTHGQDIPAQRWAPVLVFHLNGVSC